MMKVTMVTITHQNGEIVMPFPSSGRIESITVSLEDDPRNTDGLSFSKEKGAMVRLEDVDFWKHLIDWLKELNCFP